MVSIHAARRGRRPATEDNIQRAILAFQSTPPAAGGDPGYFYIEDQERSMVSIHAARRGRRPARRLLNEQADEHAFQSTPPAAGGDPSAFLSVACW